MEEIILIINILILSIINYETEEEIKKITKIILVLNGIIGIKEMNVKMKLKMIAYIADILININEKIYKIMSILLFGIFHMGGYIIMIKETEKEIIRSIIIGIQISMITNIWIILRKKIREKYGRKIQIIYYIYMNILLTTITTVIIYYVEYGEINKKMIEYMKRQIIYYICDVIIGINIGKKKNILSLISLSLYFINQQEII